MIIVDTREQANKHIIKAFDALSIEYVDETLVVGDYTMTDGTLVVERKKNLAEFANNVGKAHQRFKAELERAKALGIKMIILIEEPIGYDDIANWKNPRGKIKYRTLKTGDRKPIKPMDGEQIKKICDAWKEKYDIEFVFCRKSDSGLKIIELLGGKK